jgi:multidrug efflux pump subunit AcrA (membrane-fusion protein)
MGKKEEMTLADGKTGAAATDDLPEKALTANRKKAGKTAPDRAFIKTKKITPKRIVVLVLAIAILCGGGYGVYRLFFYEEPVQIVTGTTVRDSITTVIEGSAVTSPTIFQMLTVPIDGTVKEIHVKQGDQVTIGDALYALDTESVEEDIAELESTIADYESQLSELNENVSSLTVNAPFAGKLINVTVEDGDEVSGNTTLATLVDDSRMQLDLYFSVAYKGSITKGMQADVSVPQYMAELKGTVSAVKNVSYITSEGTECFKVTVTVDNPGALMKGLEATAVIMSDGMTMSPSDAGTLEYCQTKTIITGVSGTISLQNLEESLKVSAGTLLAVVENDDYGSEISTLEKKIKTATLTLADLNESLIDCSATAEVAGTVIFINIEAGDEVKSGASSMAVYNTETMQITANISEVQNDYITEGMEVTITKSGASADTELKGTVTKTSLEATSSNGVAYFPTTITIESKGTLSAGVYVSYSITAAQASDVVLAPVAAIQQTTAGPCLFIQADTRPENAVDLADGVVPDGYYAVVIDTGLASNEYVEITSGVSEGVTVFERYVKKNTTSGSDQTSENADSGAMPSFDGQIPGGMRPDGNFGGGGFGGGPMG